jgi:hypothetical protein
MITLPRQARDKHRKPVENRGVVVSQEGAGDWDAGDDRAWKRSGVKKIRRETLGVKLTDSCLFLLFQSPLVQFVSKTHANVAFRRKEKTVRTDRFSVHFIALCDEGAGEGRRLRRRPHPVRFCFAMLELAWNSTHCFSRFHTTQHHTTPRHATPRHAAVVVIFDCDIACLRAPEQVALEAAGRRHPHGRQEGRYFLSVFI